MANGLNRRDFSKLTAAAFGGMFAGAGGGTVLAQQKKEEEEAKILVDPALLLKEPNVCRGLNTCKGMGKGGENACAGQGARTTVKAHDCNGMNACKAQGGCGGYPGQNTCEGKGHCAVPLKKETWAIARAQLEHLYADMDKKLGKAPAAKK